jgi:hypothetical protein
VKSNSFAKSDCSIAPQEMEMYQNKRRVSVLTVSAAAVPICAVAIFLGAAASPARADLILQVFDSNAVSGGTGTFDVVFEETNGGTDAITSHTVELSISSGSGITFTGVNTSTSPAPYIYGSLQSPPFTFASFPNTQFDATDTFTNAPFQAVLNDGDVAGAAHVTYSVAPGTASEVVPVALGNDTAVSDISGVPIPFTIQNGSITVLGAVAAHAVVSLTTSAPAAYGSSQGNLTVTGSNGQYTIAQLTGLSTATGFVGISTFNPANDTEVYGIDVKDSGGQATSTELAAVLAAITGDGIAPASASVIGTDSVAGTNPYGFASNYNLYLVANPGPDASDFLGVDLSNTNDSNLSGLTFSAVAVVPEPVSLGLFAVGGVCLLARRSRRLRRR